jgi:2-keto-4-pentenoate hydratase/2-oxohepta-3-ene-1,7-dioic acid hydratase in catechol pathway
MEVEMRIAVYEGTDGVRETVVRDGAKTASLGEVPIETVIAEGETGLERLRAALAAGGSDGNRDSGRLVAPLIHPGKQIFVGVNYEDHVDELPPPWKMTEDPFVFVKMPTAIIGPDQPIKVPIEPSSVDYEVEMLAVIGKRASKVAAKDALDHVWGWTIVNDVTERSIQATDNQLTISKGIDTFCPMGPEIVLKDELEDITDLDIWTTVNGEFRQRSNTSTMIFSVDEIIERVSNLVTLEPGDTVSTGTPGGCGAYKSPPLFLQPGDVVTVGIDGIGELTNPIEAGW